MNLFLLAWKAMKQVPLKTWLYLLFLAAVAGAVLYGRHHWIAEGRAQVQAVCDAEKAKAAEDALTQAKDNQRKAEELAQGFVDLAKGFLNDKTEAKAKADAVVADLRAGNLKLRQQWQTCLSTPGKAGSGTGGADADADLRSADIGRVYGISQACTAHVKRLQDLLQLERH